MIDHLPWVIQRIILEFDIKYELHYELKKRIQINKYVKNENIPNKKFKKFVLDCIYLDNYTFINRGIKWYIWILKKIYNGDNTWIYISSDNKQLIDYLKKCYKLRFINHNKYGYSMTAWINYYINKLLYG